MMMSEQDHKEFSESLRRHRQKLLKSKKAARELLNALGMLTPGGDLKRCFKPPKNVSR